MVGDGGVKRAMPWHGTPLDRGGCVVVYARLFYTTLEYTIYTYAHGCGILVTPTYVLKGKED